MKILQTIFRDYSPATKPERYTNGDNSLMNDGPSMAAKKSFPYIKRKPVEPNGFTGLSELMIAAGVGTLLIMASGAALRSTGTLIKDSEDKSTLRQNAINGLRLMRSEVERSMHLVIDQSEPFSDDQAHINLLDDRYSPIISECINLAGDRNFKPVFGVKMSDLNQLVLYGMSSTNGHYSLERCGSPLRPDGKYNETADIFLSKVVDHIGAIPCRKEDDLKEGESLATICKIDAPTQADILNSTSFQFSQGTTPNRSELQPAFRVQTDNNYKLVKLIDPTDNNEGQDKDEIDHSFINKLGIGDKRITYQPLYFTAFARADKRVSLLGEDGNGAPLNGAFFRNITSNNVRFVIDGSGSMSACVMWGDGYGSWRTFYDPNKGRYRDSNKKCALTRMEALISEMTMILEQLPNNTKVGINAFSSSGYRNNKGWSQSASGLARLGDNDNRDSAIEFVNTLDDEKVTRWGGTDPWNAIQQAFDDKETDTMYIMSDGRPNRDRNGGNWSNQDQEPTATFYAKQNNNRKFNNQDRALIVNTTSLGLDSPWLKFLSEKTQGYYNQIDKESLTSDQNETS